MISKQRLSRPPAGERDPNMLWAWVLMLGFCLLCEAGVLFGTIAVLDWLQAP